MKGRLSSRVGKLKGAFSLERMQPGERALRALEKHVGLRARSEKAQAEMRRAFILSSW